MRKTKPGHISATFVKKHSPDLMHLKDHLNIHSGKFIILHTFWNWKFLAINVFLGTKPFSCPVCNKNFTRKGDLKQHQDTIHTEERPFICAHCEKTFNRSGSRLFMFFNYFIFKIIHSEAPRKNMQSKKSIIFC